MELTFITIDCRCLTLLEAEHILQWSVPSQTAGVWHFWKQNTSYSWAYLHRLQVSDTSGSRTHPTVELTFTDCRCLTLLEAKHILQWSLPSQTAGVWHLTARSRTHPTVELTFTDCRCLTLLEAEHIQWSLPSQTAGVWHFWKQNTYSGAYLHRLEVSETQVLDSHF